MLVRYICSWLRVLPSFCALFLAFPTYSWEWQSRTTQLLLSQEVGWFLLWWLRITEIESSFGRTGIVVYLERWICATFPIALLHWVCQSRRLYKNVVPQHSLPLRLPTDPSPREWIPVMEWETALCGSLWTTRILDLLDDPKHLNCRAGILLSVLDTGLRHSS